MFITVLTNKHRQDNSLSSCHSKASIAACSVKSTSHAYKFLPCFNKENTAKPLVEPGITVSITPAHCRPPVDTCFLNFTSPCNGFSDFVIIHDFLCLYRLAGDLPPGWFLILASPLAGQNQENWRGGRNGGA